MATQVREAVNELMYYLDVILRPEPKARTIWWEQWNAERIAALGRMMSVVHKMRAWI